MPDYSTTAMGDGTAPIPPRPRVGDGLAEGGGGPAEVEDGRPRAVTVWPGAVTVWPGAVTAMQSVVIVWPKAATTPILTRLRARAP